MQEFDHPNILRLIGVCLDGGPAPYIIMPFMTNGSLLSHLKENRDSLVVDPKTSDNKSDVVRDQVSYSYCMHDVNNRFKKITG